MKKLILIASAVLITKKIIDHANERKSINKIKVDPNLLKSTLKTEDIKVSTF